MSYHLSNNRRKGVFFAVLTNVCFAFNFTFLVLAFNSDEVAPLIVNFFRTTCASIFFVTYVLLNRSYVRKVARKDWLLLIVCALCGMSINQVLFMDGMSKTSAIHASTIALSAPLLAILFQAILLRGSPTVRKMQWLGILLGLAGAALLISNQDVSGKASIEGDIKVLANFVLYAIFLVLSKPLTERYHPVFILMILFSISFPLIVALSFPFLLDTTWEAIPLSAYVGIAGSVIFATILSHFFNLKAVAHLSPSIVAVFIYMQPIIASFLAVIFFDELWTIINTLSFVLVGTGLYFVAIKKYTTVSS